MYIISVEDETGLVLSNRSAYRTVDVDFAKHEFSVLFPNNKVSVKEYTPRTKEIAEAEVAEKLKLIKKKKKEL